MDSHQQRRSAKYSAKEINLNAKGKNLKLQYLNHVTSETKSQMLHLGKVGRFVFKKAHYRKKNGITIALFSYSSNHLFKAIVNKLQVVMLIANVRETTAF